MTSSSAICTVSGDRPASSGSSRILISMLALGVSLFQLSPSSGAALSRLLRHMLPSLLVTSRRWQTAKWLRRSLAMSAVSHSSPKRLWPLTRFRSMGTRTLPGARRFAHGTSCPCCMREFWTRLRLIHHLSCSNKACLGRVMDIVPPLSQEVQHVLDKQDTERYRQSRASGFHPMFADRPSVVLQSTFCVGALSSCRGPSLERVRLVILRCECLSAAGDSPPPHAQC